MKKIIFPALFLALIALYTVPAFAHCPLCTAATGAVVATARVVGVDDAIVGTFIGAFIISTALWTHRILMKRIKKQIPLQPYILSVVYVAITIASFYASGLLGAMPESTWIFGMERLFFGIVFGSIISVASFEFHGAMRRYNRNKNYFPLQGIVLPLAALVAFNAAMYLTGVV